MFYLVCAVVCSALVSILMRAGETKTNSSAGMFIANYLVCMILALVTRERGFTFQTGPGFGLAVIFGTISGILYLVSFVLLQLNIRKNGVVLASVFMKLGLIVSILIAIFAFGELPGMGQVIGIGIAIVAILVFNLEKKKEKVVGSGKIFLLVLLLCSGITDSMANVYDKTGVDTFKDDYLFIVFFVAGICACIMQLVQKKKICRGDIIVGCLLGIPNYFSSKFLLLALAKVNAVIVYPVYSVATIVLITFAGVLLFHEKLSRQKVLGIALVFAALILLNM